MKMLKQVLPIDIVEKLSRQLAQVLSTRLQTRVKKLRMKGHEMAMHAPNCQK